MERAIGRMENVRRGAAAVMAAVIATLVLGAILAPTPIGAADAGTPAAAGRTANARIDASAYGHRVLALTNRARRAHGCTSLHWQGRLRKAAQQHTKRMATAGRLTHRVGTERSFRQRIRGTGYRTWKRLAENIAVGYRTPTAVVSAWMRSPSHRRNLLDCRMQDLGVGVRVDRTGAVWWTQDLGRR